MNKGTITATRRITRMILSILLIAATATVASSQANEDKKPEAEENQGKPKSTVKNNDGEILEMDKFMVRAVRDGHRYGPRITNSTSRIAQDFQGLAQIVTSLPKELIQDLAAYRLEDIVKYSGGATRGPNANGDNYVIRGLATVVTGSTVDGSVSPTASDRDMFFFERVDVIKGPSSIVAPTGPAGGTVNLITKSPESEFAGYIRLQAGQNDANRVEFDVTGPTMNNSIDYRVGVAYHNADGYHDYTHRDKKLLFGGLVFHLSKENKFTLKFTHEDMQGEPDLGFTVTDTTPFYPAAVPRTSNQNPDGTFWNEHRSFGAAVLNSKLNSWLYSQIALFYSENNHTRTNGLLTQFLGGIPAGTKSTGPTNTDWVEFNGRNLALFTDFAGYYETPLGNTGKKISHTTTFGMALELASSEQNARLLAANATPIDLLAPMRNKIINPNIGTWPYQAGTQYRGKSTGLRFYLNDSATIYDKFVVSGGLSWNSGRSNTTFMAIAPDGINLLPEGSVGGRVTASTALPQTLYNYGVLYKASKLFSIYYAHNELLSFVNLVDPDTGKVAPNTETYQNEVGVKATLLSGKLQMSFAKFRIHQSGSPTVDLIRKTWIFRPGRLSDGFDLDATLQVSTKLTLIAGYGYTKVTTATGRRSLGVPESSVRIWALFNRPTEALKNFGFGIGFDHTSDRSGDLFNELDLVGLPFRTEAYPLILPAYTTVDASISYRVPQAKWEFTLKFNNIFDEMYIRQSTVPFAVVSAPGRNMLGNVTYRF